MSLRLSAEDLDFYEQATMERLRGRSVELAGLATAVTDDVEGGCFVSGKHCVILFDALMLAHTIIARREREEEQAPDSAADCKQGEEDATHS